MRTTFRGKRSVTIGGACRAYYEKILAIAQEIKRSHDAEAEERYAMPQAYDKTAQGVSERAKLLKSRYKCALLFLSSPLSDSA